MAGSLRISLQNTLEVVNEAGQKLASFLGQNASNVPEYHRNCMQVQKVDMYIRSRSQIREHPLTDPRPEPKIAASVESDVSDYEIDTTDQPISESWKVTWPLCFEDMHVSESQPDVHMSIGRGSSKAGSDRGVDLLLTCPGKPPKGVILIHAFGRLHAESGSPMIGGVRDAHPVRLPIKTDGQYKELGANK